ncbi:MAG TPA: VOC family protein [Pseudolabrys sp.]|nr:VOC family protein [Pseudolabrys sp.]
MGGGIDHIVHAVRDLDAAAELYRRMGFTVGARNRHSWGTHNYIVQMPGTFIELLTLAEPEKLGDDGFSNLFGAYTGDFLKRHEGLSLLILESRDARDDEQAFGRAGVAASEVMRFEREGKRPDGSIVKVAFSLAFAQDKAAPDIHFATCQQHYPENFWNPKFQVHANGVRSVSGVVIVAGEPSRHRDFLSAFARSRDWQASAGGFTLATPRGVIEIMNPSGYSRQFGVDAPDTAGGARLAAMRLAVGNLAAAEALLRSAKIQAAGVGGRLVVGPRAAMGAALVFETMNDGSR